MAVRLRGSEPPARLPWSGPAARQVAGHPATKSARRVADQSAAAAAKATKGVLHHSVEKTM